MITGHIFLDDNMLTLKKVFPKLVDGFFSISNNKLTSLEYSPEEVNGFYCNGNDLKTLKGCTKNIWRF